MNTMDNVRKLPIQFFDKMQSLAIVDRRLPHWSQAGTLCFITFRAWDSMPQHVVMQWLAERNAFLLKHGIDPQLPTWQAEFQKLASEEQAEFHELLSQRWSDQLDRCCGSCVMRRPEIAQIVVDSLQHFDEDRYWLTDFVVMPNHVHVLVSFPDESALLQQCESWKHFTATKINRTLRRNGRFWQQDGFDHLVRSVDQFYYLRKYIAENPTKAKLAAEEYRHFSKVLV